MFQRISFEITSGQKSWYVHREDNGDIWGDSSSLQYAFIRS